MCLGCVDNLLGLYLLEKFTEDCVSLRVLGDLAAGWENWIYDVLVWLTVNGQQWKVRRYPLLVYLIDLRVLLRQNILPQIRSYRHQFSVHLHILNSLLVLLWHGEAHLSIYIIWIGFSIFYTRILVKITMPAPNSTLWLGSFAHELFFLVGSVDCVLRGFNTVNYAAEWGCQGVTR